MKKKRITSLPSLTIRFVCVMVFFMAFTQGPAIAAGTCGTGTWTPGNLEIHHINIGQGDSTLIVGPTGKSLLFDAGESSWNSSAKAQIIGPYVQAVLGCNSLDYVVISHFHLDHIGYVGYGGLYHLVETQGFTVGTTLVRNYHAYLGGTSGTFTNWKTYLEGTGNTKLHPATAVEGTGQVNLGPGITFDIVTVDGNGSIVAGNFSGDASPPSENDYCIGAVISYGNFDEWMGGDLDGQYEVGGFGYTYHDIELSVAPEVGDVDVYKANHHASSHSSSATFINQIDPEVSIVTVGDGNTYGHPTQSIMDRLLATSTVYMTERGDTNTNVGSAIVAGNIVIKTSDGSSYTVNGTSYTATEPTRVDADGDGYYLELDPNDSHPGTLPAPNGGCGPIYQTCSVSCQVTTGQVVINEVLPSPSSGSEWVELYNTTDSAINLGYCYIDDIVAGSTPYQIPEGTLIPSHGFWTLDRSSYFNNPGDDVRFLKEDQITILDNYTYGNTTYDVSWYRAIDGNAWAPTSTSLISKGISNHPFTDVPPLHSYYADIKTLYINGYTAGCSTSPLQFCPDVSMSRAQSAVFMLRGNFGSGYVPVTPTHFFKDNWKNSQWGEGWAESMYLEGLTGGCSSSPLKFCPDVTLSNVQLAVFGLRLKYGMTYSPPAATGTVFADMTDVNFWGTGWAEQAYADGLIPACGTSGGKPLFCPDGLVSRGFGASVIVKAKNLTMP